MIPREEILNDLDFYGNDLAGGEGDVPGIIVRNVPPEVRREVRNAHYNLGHPSTATHPSEADASSGSKRCCPEIRQVVEVSTV